jgi:hypothetical protein
MQALDSSPEHHTRSSAIVTRCFLRERPRHRLNFDTELQANTSQDCRGGIRAKSCGAFIIQEYTSPPVCADEGDSREGCREEAAATGPRRRGHHLKVGKREKIQKTALRRNLAFSGVCVALSRPFQRRKYHPDPDSSVVRHGIFLDHRVRVVSQLSRYNRHVDF